MIDGLALDVSWLTPQLSMGACLPPSAVEHLRALGVSHVVDLREEACDDGAALRRAGLALLHLPAPDRCGLAVARLDHGVAWVARAIDGGGRAYVHCQHGIGRSALLALCVLVHRGEAPLAALALAKRARPVVSPSPEQLEAFRAWLAARRLGPPRFDDLAALAYAAPRPADGAAAAPGP